MLPSSTFATAQSTCCSETIAESATPPITVSTSSVTGITALTVTSYAAELDAPNDSTVAVYVMMSPPSTSELGVKLTGLSILNRGPTIVTAAILVTMDDSTPRADDTVRTWPMELLPRSATNAMTSTTIVSLASLMLSNVLTSSPNAHVTTLALMVPLVSSFWLEIQLPTETTYVLRIVRPAGKVMLIVATMLSSASVAVAR